MRKKLKRSTVAVVALAALLAVTFAGASARAGSLPTDRSFLTFSGSVSLPGVTLDKGTYVFERLDVNNPHVVRVMSRERSHVYFTGFTLVVERPSGQSRKRMITFREGPKGSAPEIDAWYPEGSSTGEQFMYWR